MILPRTSTPELHDLDDGVDRSATAASAAESLRLVETGAGEEELPLRSLLDAVLAELRQSRRRKTRIVVKTGGKVMFLRPEQVEWIEAAGNYVRLHVGGESHLFRESMKNMETRLDSDVFVRIHRSAIVNVDHIRELQPWFHGEYVVILHDGTRLMASRVFSDRLDRLIA